MKTMIKKAAYSLAAMCLAVILFTACGKKGCTDAYATNYCDECKKDDGSCTYKATVQFWYDKATADDLINNVNSTSLTYYVDGVIIGSSAASVYFTGEPSCSQNGVVGVTKDLGKLKTKTSTYKVVDNNDETLWEGSVTFDATKSCTSIQLTN